ncbi:hypothetical protein G9X68_14295 [Rhizobium sp. WYCCWR 11279]|uniref:hypothetical protein n=1 Tax=Rhizobium changzhiense TaxID=2692317 RepID=UPI00149322FD|nr:hypothetical protein [Rhizobium changzhiense]NNU48277.1 hypothetical protein [Rhizobium changzhiense]
MAGPSETLIGRRVSAVAFAIYAADGAETLPDAVSELRLLIHADLSRTARVRAFNTFVWWGNGICWRGVGICLLAIGSVNATDISEW